MSYYYERSEDNYLYTSPEEMELMHVCDEVKVLLKTRAAVDKAIKTIDNWIRRGSLYENTEISKATTAVSESLSAVGTQLNNLQDLIRRAIGITLAPAPLGDDRPF
jgi:hypothetical protein